MDARVTTDRVIGHECSAVVDAIGPGVDAVEPGDPVVVRPLSHCGECPACRLGFKTLNPLKGNVAEAVYEATGDNGADVVFEVSGSKPGAATMTEAASVRGRIVMVAIHAQKPEVDLFTFFWRELELLGARVYQPEDYEQAIELVLSGAIDCDTLITDTRELEDITAAFQALDGNATAMKSLLKCS
jgi:threonine dehydrogenase-like Zn-dependent dehydrogenase